MGLEGLNVEEIVKLAAALVSAPACACIAWQG